MKKLVDKIRPTEWAFFSIPTTATGVLLDRLRHGSRRSGRIGCDRQRVAAGDVSRNSPEADAAFFASYREYRAVTLIVGLPLHADGRESDKSREARAFGAWLSEVSALPVVFWDERFTTALAEDALLSAKLTNKKRKERRDRVAAQMILQNYIDAGCPPEGTVIVSTS